MNLSNNFNYSGNKANIDIGEIVVDFGFSYLPEQVKYVQMVDNFQNWRTVPKKTLPNPYGSGFITVVPDSKSPFDVTNRQFTRRQLWVNPIGGGNENVTLPVVAGKKWYLDSISFRAYEMHEYLPSWKPNLLIEKTGATGVTDLFIPDAFGLGLQGVVVGWNLDDIITWDLSPFTTNSYPDFGQTNNDETNAGLVAATGTGRYGKNWGTQDHLKQSGSGSAVIGGMLATDFFPNNFSFNISGSNSATGIVTGLSDMIFGSDQYTTYRNGTGNFSHTSLPLQLSNMNIEINYPYLGVEVYGAGYYHYLYWSEIQNPDESVRNMYFPAPTPRTIVQFPLICELIIVQR